MSGPEMPVAVLYPKVSLESDSGRVARWLVSEGEQVRSGQILFEIDNDKAAVEVESPADGIIRNLADPEAEVAVGAEVARIEAGADAEATTDTGTPPAAPPTPIATPAAAPGPAAAKPVPQPMQQRGPLPTPLARRIARERNLDLSGLTGTGPRGRVQKRDVLALLTAPGLQAGAGPHAGAPDASGISAPALATGGTLHAAWLRQGTGAPVVLLHGFASDLNGWRGMFAGARAETPVLALDLPAHGKSPRAVPADLDDMAAAVEATLSGLGTGPMLLAGHSLGGAVAARIAARGVADVRALCLFAPAGLGPQIDTAFTAGILRATSAASLRPWLDMLVHDPAVISAAFLRAVVDQRGDTGLADAMRALGARFFPDGTQAFSIRGDLARLSVPARVVFGRDDRILPFHATRGLPGHIALHCIDACGHMPHLEHPDLSRRILRELHRCI